MHAAVPAGPGPCASPPARRVLRLPLRGPACLCPPCLAMRAPFQAHVRDLRMHPGACQVTHSQPSINAGLGVADAGRSQAAQAPERHQRGTRRKAAS
eukprot:7976563-Alexandrium_andersonii.AAC.1